MMNEAEFNDLLEKCLEGSASTDEQQRVIDASSQSPEFQNKLRQAVISDGALRGANRDAEEFIRTTLEKITRKGSSGKFAREMRNVVAQSRQKPKHRSNFMWPLLAASILAAAGVILYLNSTSTSPQTPVELATITAGKGSLLRADKQSVLAKGMRLRDGDRIVSGDTSGDRLTLLFDDGSELDVNASTALLLSQESGAKRLKLEHGDIYVEAAKQPAGRDWIIRTPGPDVMIVGTKFEVSARDSGVTLSVLEGQVRFGSGGNVTLVQGGQVSFAKPGAAAGSPTVLTGVVASWRGNQQTAQPQPQPQPPAVPTPVPAPETFTAIVAGEFPDETHWTITKTNVDCQFTKAGVKVHGGNEKDTPSLRLTAKDTITLKDDQILSVRLKVNAVTKSAATGISLLDGDDPANGAKPHLTLGCSSHFADTMLAVRTFPDAPLNYKEEGGTVNRLHHGRWNQPSPKDSLLELFVSNDEVRLRVDGQDYGTYKHGLHVKHWRLSLNGLLTVGWNQQSQVSLKELAVKIEPK